MNFDDWLLSGGLKLSSVHNYIGALKGSLSEWAIDAGIIDCNLLEITSASKFGAVALRIQELNVFRERNSTGHNMYSTALNQYSRYLASGAIQSIEEDVEEILESQSLASTEKARLINTRIGQGDFRTGLLRYWKKCAVTGVSDPAMLLASHIKPWSKCDDLERLDPNNRLLLSPTLDRAFDQGLISFSNEGDILISPLFRDAAVLGITEDMRVSLAKEHLVYMEFHRANVFQASSKSS